MRSSKSRSRSKSNRQRSLGNIVNRVFDSSGPEGKVRGTPQQIIDKYLSLARDAQLSNDRVAEQAFLQHAEHYTRMLGEAQREMAERQQHQQQNHQPQHHNQRGNDDQPQPRGDEDNRPNPPEAMAEPAPERRPAPDSAEAPADEPRRPNRGGRRKEAALPDALGTDGDEAEGRVNTPEEQADDKPAPRRPHAPRNPSAAPRTRRKPAADQPADSAPAEGGDQG